MGARLNFEMNRAERGFDYAAQEHWLDAEIAVEMATCGWLGHHMPQFGDLQVKAGTENTLVALDEFNS